MGAMRRATRRAGGRAVALLAGALLLGALGALEPPPVSAQAARSDDDVRILMGRNFEAIQRIFARLSERDYQAVIPEAEILIRHGEQIARQGRERPTMFHAYAFKLKSHAENLLAVSRSLKESGRLPDEAVGETDFLHDVAAADFGEIVATCLSCHGRYRP